jgi:hypothetical protein
MPCPPQRQHRIASVSWLQVAVMVAVAVVVAALRRKPPASPHPVPRWFVWFLSIPPVTVLG